MTEALAPTSSPAAVVSLVAWDDARAVALRTAMTTELHARYAPWLAELTGGAGVDEALEDHIDPSIVAVTVLAELDGEPVGQAALIRSRAAGHEGELEVKRVYVAPRARRRGVSRALLAALEAWATRAGAPRLILGTGPLQPDAIALYRATGYEEIPSFAPEPWAAHVSCFAKRLDDAGGRIG